MKKRTKALLSLLLAASMCLTVVGCGADGAQNGTDDSSVPESTEQNGEVITGEESETLFSNVEGLPETLDNPDITVVYWYNQDQYQYDTSKNENVYDPILEAIPYFEEKYGGEVNVVYAAWSDMLETVLALQKAGDAPDLFEVYSESMYSTILSGVVMPLDDYTTDADYSYFDVDKSLFSWKDSVYAIPLKPYTRYIMFNRDLFELEGLKSPDELFREGNWNWTTFTEACKALTKTANGASSQLGYGGWEESILWFMYADGTTLLNIDTQAGTITSNMSDIKFQNTVNYLEGLKDTFVYGNDMWGWFDNGTMGMICGKEYPVDVPFEVGMVPFPVGDDYDGKNLVVYPQGMAVPNGASNPEGAVAFMRIVSELQLSVGNQKEANRIGQENYDMVYAEDVKTVYAYDQCLPDSGHVIASIVNSMNDGVPAATIAANMESEVQANINLLLGD